MDPLKVLKKVVPQQHYFCQYLRKLTKVMLLWPDFFLNFQWFQWSEMTVLYLYLVVWGVTDWSFSISGSNCSHTVVLCHYPCFFAQLSSPPILSWRGLGKIHCFPFKHVLKKIYFFYWNTIWKRTIEDELFPTFSSILYSLFIWNISPQVISLKPTLATGKNCYQFKLLYGLFVVAIVTGFFSVLGWSLFTLSAHLSFLLL